MATGKSTSGPHKHTQFRGTSTNKLKTNPDFRAEKVGVHILRGVSNVCGIFCMGVTDCTCADFILCVFVAFSTLAGTLPQVFLQSDLMIHAKLAQRLVPSLARPRTITAVLRATLHRRNGPGESCKLVDNAHTSQHTLIRRPCSTHHPKRTISPPRRSLL